MQEQIVTGLNRYDLFVLGLAEKRSITLVFDGIGERSVMIDLILRDSPTTCIVCGSILQKLHRWPLVAFSCAVNLVDGTGVAEIEEACLICHKPTENAEFCSDGTCGCSAVRTNSVGEIFDILPERWKKRLFAF